MHRPDPEQHLHGVVARIKRNSLKLYQDFWDQTAEGRRNRRVILTGAANAVSTASVAVVGLASIAITIPYLGREQYGMWVTTLSWIQLLAVADLGIGNSLVNRLASSYADGDLEDARMAISTSFFLTAAAAMLLIVLGFSALAAAHWTGTMFRLGPQPGAMETLVMVMLVGTAIDIPLGTAGRVYSAMQEGYVTAIWMIVASVLSLAGVYVTVRLGLGLPFVAGGALLGRLVSKVAATAVLVRSKPALKPSSAAIDKTCARELLSLGSWYSAANIGFILESQVLYLVGPAAVGFSAVAEGAIVHRIYGTLLMVPMFFIGPLWPAYGEALKRRDDRWVKRTLSLSRRLGFFCIIGATAIGTVVGPAGIRWWLHGRVSTDRVLLAAGGLWFAQRVWREVHTTFLNGAGRLRGQGTYGVAGAIVEAVLAYLGGRRFGTPGVFAGWFLGFAVLTGGCLILECSRTLRNREADLALG